MPEHQNGPSSSRPPRPSQARRKGRSTSNDNAVDDEKSTSPLPSPGDWNVDRGRSRVRRPSNTFSEDNLRRRGYHALLSSFGKVFHVEKRWKLIREMGSGAYGVVISAEDDISGETVAIKQVTRVFDKVQLAKRALREITLLRHFAGHENITGLIDVDAISRDFNEIYIFMEPMEADLHQIIKSGQTLTNEHVQYFLYQILRGMKFVHSASVIHRDLKPGNLLVNSDCELKICDFGLSRGFEARLDEHATHLTEYVATRWYRAPEIMLAFRRYNTAIDVWSIGCIFAELMMGKPLFKGKDYVDQLNKVLDVLGTPEERVIKKIGSEKAQAYVRSLPFKKTVPFRKIIPTADPQALDLLGKMLAFDPDDRINVVQALEHPWLASYHDVADEPECPSKFEKWKMIEELETMDDFREALWNEIEDYRREVRGVSDLDGMPIRMTRSRTKSVPSVEREVTGKENGHGATHVQKEKTIVESPEAEKTDDAIVPPQLTEEPETAEEEEQASETLGPLPEDLAARRAPTATTVNDPVVTYARRSSIISRQGSTFNSPAPSAQHLPAYVEGIVAGAEPPAPQNGGQGTIAFPTQGYVVPARSRTGSTVGGEPVPRRLLRTLSTVSIHESLDGAADIPPIVKYITERTGDAPPSEMPREFINEASEEDEQLQLSTGTGPKKKLFQID